MHNGAHTSENTRHPVYFLMGPTASGKTDLALSLATRFAVEIISVDSAQIYRGMDIGTAKPDVEQRRRVPHHLIDILDPAQSYSVARFRQDALDCIAAIIQRGRIPLLVGGTMMYYKALQFGMHDIPVSTPQVRDQVAAMERESGLPWLHDELARVDPAAAGRIHPNDPQRIKRALEVYLMTGKPLSLFWQAQPRAFPYRTVKFVIYHGDKSRRDELISHRFDAMLDNGLLEEVRALYNRSDLHENLPSIRMVGYRQVWRYLQGKCDLARMREEALTATRQLAKRQMTWIRNHHQDGVRFTLEQSGVADQISLRISRENKGYGA